MAEELTQNTDNPKSSILDTIMGSQTQSNLVKFEPGVLVSTLLNLLKERDREIVTKRFGLNGVEVETLEAIGKKNNLTRERVRQIEKDSVNFLKKSKTKELQQALELVFDTIIEHGNIMSEEFLIQTMLVGRDEHRNRQALKFLLCLSDQFIYMKETAEFWPSWHVAGFDIERLRQVIAKLTEILQGIGKVVAQDELYQKFEATEFFRQHALELNSRVFKSYLNISKAIQINPFSELGLKDWTEIKPRDVGDKAYLVLKHHGKPEHYSVITKLINDHKFDSREAYQETVHNELIKDSRFVLIGRGIYALSEWGYTKGVVADVIRDVLKGSDRPLSREEIINEVLKRRQVKRNTILVGLSNKKYFTKIGKDKYVLAESQPVNQ
jgi:DNA-directed RNA polymerase delta subunit